MERNRRMASLTNRGPGISRRSLLGGVSALALLGGGSTLLSACGSNDSSGSASSDKLESLRKSGVAKLGMSATAPYCYVKDGKPTGFENDEAIMILKSLGIDKVEPVVVDFASLIPGLLSNRFDVCTGALYVTSERCGQVLFANPDNGSFEAFAVAKGNPKGITDYDTLAKSGGKLACIAGTQEIGFAKDAGVSSSNVTQFPDAVGALQALKAGRVDAVGYDSGTLGYQATLPSFSDLTITDAFTVPAGATPSFSAMAFAPDAKSLRDAYNTELKKLQDSGDLWTLAEGYGFQKANIESCYGVTTTSIGCKDAS
jgi:polar amino acid transport system substrate-binding protein